MINYIDKEKGIIEVYMYPDDKNGKGAHDAIILIHNHFEESMDIVGNRIDELSNKWIDLNLFKKDIYWLEYISDGLKDMEVDFDIYRNCYGDFY